MNNASLQSELADKVAVITGGADGIGLGIAHRCRAAGAQVLIADVNAETVATLSNQSGYHGLVCDVSKDEDVARMRTAAQALGEVSLVVANAGIAVGGRFEQIPMTEWQRLFEVNVFGVVRTIQAFLPDLMSRGSGRVVVTGSSAGLFTSGGMDAPYTASKYALRGMAHALANYGKSGGVSVHYLAPRLTDTVFPKSAVAWGRRGSRVTSDRALGDDFDSVDAVVDALFNGMQDNRFLISLTPDTRERLMGYADDPLKVF
ncbi:MAG: SDR family NAD(P)-dependent oxidoreductase [bacterium]